MRILGADNGLDGALALVEADSTVAAFIMPVVVVKDSKRDYDVTAIVRLLRELKPDHVFIEKAQSMPGQGVASMFSTGRGYGLMCGIVAALEIPYTLVHPKTWQKVMFKDLPKSDTKAMSYIVCSRLWPKHSWRASPRCKKPHDGMTDAALIALYGWRSLNSKSPTWQADECSVEDIEI